MTDKETIFRKLKLKNSEENLILYAPKAYHVILQGVEFDDFPLESKSGK